MRWFKFYGQDWLTDTKILGMSIEDRLIYITLLSLADEKGVIKDCGEYVILKMTGLTDNPYEDTDEWRRGEGFLKRFVDNGMITIDNERDVIIKNWVKRQSQTSTGYERVKRWREKRKLENTPYLESLNDNDDNVTSRYHDNARIEENRIDIPANAEIKIVSSREENTEREPRTSVKYPHSREVFSWFPNPQKSWLSLKNVQEREYAEYLWERGEDAVKKALKYHETHKDDDGYGFRVVKPSDLEKKWADIAEYARRT